MSHKQASSSAIGRWLVLAVPAAVVLAASTHVAAQTVLSVGPFRSIALHGGGEVILRHGPEYRVTLVRGSADYTKAWVADGERLVVDRCRNRCPRGYKMTVEVTAPDLDAILVMDGGTIEARGGFPRKASLRVAVEDGGTIDLRAMAVESVAAAVEDGGRIFTKPHKTLIGSVARGGIIAYWGSPRVTSSIEDGGVVSRGKLADADKPLDEIGPAAPAIPPIPPVPPLPPAPTTRVREIF